MGKVSQTIRDMSKCGLGWLPDVPDARDFRFAHMPMKMVSPKKLPAIIDRSAECSPVEDQLTLGSCVLNALAGAKEFLDLKDDGKYTDVSRLAMYYWARRRMGLAYIGIDSGTYVRTGIKVMLKDGCPPEALWPYDVTKFKRKPTKAVEQAGAKNTIKAYYRIDDPIKQVKQALANGFIVPFGFTVYSNMMTDQVAKTGVIPLPGGTCEGGHATDIVGMDDTKRLAKIRNSWNVTWGVKGYGFLPYEFLESRDLSDDFWVITK